MIISIDFDDTFTADPITWKWVIKLLQSSSHTVVCVTGRHGTQEDIDETSAALPAGIPVVFAGDEAKNDAAILAGYAVDVWIDDQPARVMGKFARFEKVIRSTRGRSYAK
jgi:hypothetical protein